MASESEKRRWGDWSHHVLASIERIDGIVSGHDKEIDNLRISMAVINVKIALWSAVGSFISAIFGTVLAHFAIIYLKSP